MKIKIDTDDLEVGMYVSELDRPWLETPFLFQGFQISGQGDLRELQRLCEHVYIDREKSSDDSLLTLSITMPQSVKTQREEKTSAGLPHLKQVEDELAAAREIRVTAEAFVNEMLTEARLGRAIDVKRAHHIVADMVESLIRNPDALLLLSSIKSQDSDCEAHAINTSILSLTLGSYLELPHTQLRELGLAALLHDVGKTALPRTLSRHGATTPEETKQLQRHAGLGAEILARHEGMPQSVVDVAHSHHEQIDGKGYPRRLNGDEISLFAKIVTITDVYDHLTRSSREQPLTSSEALRYTYLYRDRFFDAGLTEQFIQCLGIYPVGSVVELSTGQVGIVISIPPETRLYPRLLLVRDKDKRPYERPRIMSLAQFASRNGAEKYTIKRVLPSDAYGIDLKSYLLSESVL